MDQLDEFIPISAVSEEEDAPSDAEDDEDLQNAAEAQRYLHVRLCAPPVSPPRHLCITLTTPPY